jgi:hypothetical protein
MARWRWVVTSRVRAFASEGRVRFTNKAGLELKALVLPLGHDEALDVLASLTPDEASGQLRSSVSGEWLYVYRPLVAGVLLYIKLALREDCVVISFHTEEDQGEKEDPI